MVDYARAMDPAIDWKTLAAALTSGDDAGLGRASEALGVRFTPQGTAALVAVHRAPRDQFVSVGQLLAFLDATLTDPAGLRVDRTKVTGHGGTHVHWLGVRWSDGPRAVVTVGLRRHFGSARLDAAWPELAGWAKKTAANHALAVRWAQAAANDRVTLEVTRGAAPSPSPSPSPSRDEASLRAAIVDAPDDPGPRSVYADWLLERNRPLGELINLSSAPGDHRARIKALKERLWNQLGPVTHYSTPVDFVGGFITQVKMTVPAFERDGEALFREHPIRTLELDTDTLTSAHLERLAQAPAIARVRCLLLALGQFTEKRLELAGLARGVTLDRLEELRLTRVGVSADDWRALFEGLRAPRLRSVHLIGTRTSSSTLAALARNPTVEQLEALIDSPNECLDAPSHRRWDETFTLIARRLPSLRRLVLNGGHTGLGVGALAALFAPTSRVSLEELTVRWNDDDDALVELIASSPRASRLTHLTLGGGRVTARSVEALLGAAHLPLTRLDVSLPKSAKERRAVYDLLLAAPSTHPLKQLRLWRADDVPPALRARFTVET